MNFQPRPHLTKAEQRLPFECVALLLQGGGALGAYQGGVYEALAEANIHPDWIAGISIGAINGAIIAGNAPEHRIARLREFWNTISQPACWPASTPSLDKALEPIDDWRRQVWNGYSAWLALVEGQRGFFT